MNTFEKIIEALGYIIPDEQIPSYFGWFHILMTIIIIAVTLYLCIFKKNASDKFYRNTVFVWWIIIFIFEIIKQFVFSLSVDNGVATWSYPWYIFPFQFCSMPLYIFPLIALLKDSKFRDSLISFAAFWVMFAGTTVFAYPVQAFCGYGLINVQTMLHHGSQVIIGAYSIVFYRNRINLSYFLNGIITFIIICVIAVGLNEIEYYTSFTNGSYFNLFYISSHFVSTLPILGDIYVSLNAGSNIFGYLVFLLTYIIGFSIGAFIIYAVTCMCQKKKLFK